METELELEENTKIEEKRSRRKRRRKLFVIIVCWILANILILGIFYLVLAVRMQENLEEGRIEMSDRIGLNEEIPEGAEYDKALAAVCDNGIYVGQEKNNVRSYKGIPFAEPPVGALRWKPPVDAGPNTRVYEARYFGKSGIQTEAETERASFYTQGEDCLTLNVWCSGDPDEKKAVMVFFPGGAYGWGGTADPLYDGQHFVEAHPDIVLVTANYRIGLMGFIDLSEVEGGEDYKESGNLGLLDQISALRWVQRNIGEFGGDPENVTIFGESAGASSVSLLPLIDEADGLFKRVIAESGSIGFTYSKEECKAFTEMLLKKSKAKNMDDLLSLSEEELMALNEDLNDYNNFPERDGFVLPEDLYKAYESGMASGVSILSGTNADEDRYFMADLGGYSVYKVAGGLIYNSLVDQMEKEDQAYARAFMQLQHDTPLWNMTEFMNDLVFRVPATTQAALHSAAGGTDYMYYWTKESTIEHYGACHAVELAYVFNNLDDTIYIGSPADPELAAAVQEMWVNFAKTGDPSTEKYQWDPYDDHYRNTMFLGDEIKMVEDPLKEQRVLIEPLLKYRINGYYMMADIAILYLKDQVKKVLLALLIANAVVFGFVQIRRLLKKRRSRITDIEEE